MPATAGQTRCFQAFDVALNQACEGAKKRWYASTLELQLTSLDICTTCRSISVLRVRVEDQAPTSLWSPPEARTRPSTSSLKIRSSSRVPVVRALQLIWALPLKDLLRRASIELWTSSEYLELRGSLCTATLAAVVWPRGLTQLVLDAELDGLLRDVSYPMRLERLVLGKFNQAIAEVVWPAFLKQLSFGNDFNQPIQGVVWPASLQHLTFGMEFTQPIAGVVWPASLQQFFFGSRFEAAHVRSPQRPCNS